ncbi:MAG: pyridoxal-dependent decarboxylase [Planctomycetaceae bacterium]|nr:pyridoxal-dependent decarboxylase [Planctomycetaceae bacterium]
MPAVDSALDLLDRIYSSEDFDRMSAIWQQAMGHHFQQVLAGDTRVLNWTEPADAVALAESLMAGGTATADRGERFESLLTQMLRSGHNLHHSGYIGHQVPANAPIAGLFDAVGSMTNQPMAVYEMGPWATAVEHAIVRAMCRKVGWDPEQSTGVLTHGGSLANLTALLTARNVVFPDSWRNGTPDNAVLISQSDAHYCVARSAGILGLGTKRILAVDVDDQRRMCPERLERVLQQARDDGQQPLAVVACACATPIGAFDPLDRIADVCEQYQVWLHVDAAHGGAALMSRQHRGLLRGVERADSVVWDAHKMMFVPALCAAVLLKNREHRFHTFEQDAPYLFDPDNPGMAEYDNGVRTVECTKRSLGFGLWGMWSLYGDEVFERLVDRVFDRCRFAWQTVCDDERFESLHEPDCNILVFRYLPESLRAAAPDLVNAVQRKIRAALIRSGDFYIVQTTIAGQVCLRMCFMNPATTEQKVASALQNIAELGEQFAAEAMDAD